MVTCEVRLVDAFADEPLAGAPVAVAPDGSELTENQLLAIGAELGTAGIVTPNSDGLRCVHREDTYPDVDAAVAGTTALLATDRLSSDEQTLTLAGIEREATYGVTVDDNRAVSVSLPDQTVRDAEVDIETLAAALGIDPDGLEAIGEDLPPGVVEEYGGSLFACLDYFENLSGIRPQTDLLQSVLSTTDCTRLFAFSFDTLESASQLHARIFEPTITEGERVPSGVAVGGCGAYLAENRAFDGETPGLTVESGYFIDRPATVHTTLAAAPTVTGHALTVMDGTISIPAAETDDIIEA